MHAPATGGRENDQDQNQDLTSFTGCAALLVCGPRAPAPLGAEPVSNSNNNKKMKNMTNKINSSNHIKCNNIKNIMIITIVITKNRRSTVVIRPCCSITSLSERP